MENDGCACGKGANPEGSKGVTRREAGALLADLLPRLPREECQTCDCFQGFLTQLELDAIEDIDDLLAPHRVDRDAMHGCLGCDPCPPGSAFAEYLRSR